MPHFAHRFLSCLDAYFADEPADFASEPDNDPPAANPQQDQEDGILDATTQVMVYE